MSRKPYVREMSRSWWWLSRRRYTAYMIRELTCVLIGAYSALLVVGLMRLSQGRGAYDGFLEALWSPLGLAFHLVAFGFALYHTTSWFNVTPKAMPLRVGAQRGAQAHGLPVGVQVDLARRAGLEVLLEGGALVRRELAVEVAHQEVDEFLAGDHSGA